MASGALQAAIDRLYGVPLEDFVPERTRAAKELRAEGEKDAAKQLAKLPKPTAASWALNHVAREEPEAVAAWLEAAAELREVSTHAAQAGGDRVRAAMGAHRDATAALAAVVAERARPGGRALSEAMLDRVRGLLQAATADAGMAELLRAGRITEEPGEVPFPAVADEEAEPEEEAEPDEGTEPEPEPEPEPRRKRRRATTPAPDAAPEPEPDPAAARRAELQELLDAAEAEAQRRRTDTVERDAEAEAADERLQEARRTVRRLESEAAAALDAVTDAEEAALAAEREVRRLRGLLRRAG